MLTKEYLTEYIAHLDDSFATICNEGERKLAESHIEALECIAALEIELRECLWIVEVNDPWSFNGWKERVRELLQEEE